MCGENNKMWTVRISTNLSKGWWTTAVPLMSTRGHNFILNERFHHTSIQRNQTLKIVWEVITAQDLSSIFITSSFESQALGRFRRGNPQLLSVGGKDGAGLVLHVFVEGFFAWTSAFYHVVYAVRCASECRFKLPWGDSQEWISFTLITSTKGGYMAICLFVCLTLSKITWTDMIGF